MATEDLTHAFLVGRDQYLIENLAFQGILDLDTNTFRLQVAEVGSQTWVDWLTVDSTGQVSITSLVIPGLIVDWADITGTPTTFAGYGVTVGALATLALSGKLITYQGVATAGWGVGAIVASGRSPAQAAAVASVTTYTVGVADGSFLVSANVNVLVSTTHTIAVQVDYQDETGASRTQTLAFSQLAGTRVTSITNGTGAGPYAGEPTRIRALAGSTITVKTTGTFTTVSYNVEADLTQVA